VPTPRLGRISASACLAAGLVLGFATRAETTALIADRDTMITTRDDHTSSGATGRVCVGRNGQGSTCRALFHFDVSGIPAGSTVTAAEVDLWIDPNSIAPGGDVDLFPLLEDWGEGGSVAPQGGCQGAAAAQDDATWDFRFYDVGSGAGTAWATRGGTMSFPASATLRVDNVAGVNTWISAQLAADVQGWIDSSGATNFGWLVRQTVEAGSANALRFRTRQNGSTSQRPRLRVTFDPPVVDGACCLPGNTCIDVSAAECLAQGGLFQGVGTSCATTVCIDPTGACCDPSGSCQELTELNCTAGGGSYVGDDESCALADCPIVLEPFVDPLPRPAVAQPITGIPGGEASYTISMREVRQKLHRDLPSTTVWGYGDGPSGATYPGPTIEARVDAPVTIEFVNDLRDLSAPGEPKPLRTDHYLAVAGTAPPPECHIHGAEDRAKTVVHLHGGHVPAVFDGYPEDNYDPGESLTFVYPNDQQPGTIWYHDHALGITRLNVYMGLAGFYLIRDEFEQSLGLPAGEFEIPLAIQDRSFFPDGSLDYPADIQEMFLGDFALVNGVVWPRLDVKQGKYRFRLLNGSGTRSYSMTLNRLGQIGIRNLTFVQIGTDGGLIEAPLPLDEITLAPAERADVIVDFEGLPVGTRVILTNDDPDLPFVMKFVVLDEAGDTGAIPAALRPLRRLEEFDAIRSRDFTLQKSGDACGGIWKINDLGWDDIVEYPQLGTTEIWRFVNPSNVTHPMHMHLVFFQLLDRIPIGGGPPVPPEPSEVGWKDTVRAPPGMITRVIARFEDYSGKYAYHCHILEHEDHEMMRQFWSVEAIELSWDGAGMSWPAQPGATGYDVVRGDLNELVASGGNFFLSSVTETCVAADTGATSFTDPTPVPPGDGFWYLTRAIDAGGTSTYDSGFGSQQDFRDDEIAGSGNDCP